MIKDYWKKSYYCDCGGESIVISYDYEDETTTDSNMVIDLAFFKQGFDSKGFLSWKERIRWCWEIIRRGTVWCDMVVLSQSTARSLGNDLIKFGNKK